MAGLSDELDQFAKQLSRGQGIQRQLAGTLLEQGCAFAAETVNAVGRIASRGRMASPALVSEYQTRLPDKKPLQSKLHEFYELARGHSGPSIEAREPVEMKTKKRKRET